MGAVDGYSTCRVGYSTCRDVAGTQCWWNLCCLLAVWPQEISQFLQLCEVGQARRTLGKTGCCSLSEAFCVVVFSHKSIILKKLCRNTNSDFPAGAIFCPPSCSGKQHMCPGDSPSERVSLENIPVLKGQGRGPLRGIELSLEKVWEEDWGKRT